MPQIVVLGGMPIQKTKTLRIDRLKDVRGNFTYLEIDYNDNSVILRNLKEIHSWDGGVPGDEKIINTELIDFT